MSHEQILVDAYGKALAYLLSRGFTLDESEDATANARLAALRHWPSQLPQNPEAWLIQVALRRALDDRRNRHSPEALDPSSEPMIEPDLSTTFPDERIRLLFLCAHPALSSDSRTPLMLQLVLGLNSQEIALLLRENPSTVAQRLVRAKRKIREAGMGPTEPEAEELEARLNDVHEAIYGLAAHVWRGLDTYDAREALHLSSLLATLMPGDAETLGLNALILFSEARRGARGVATGTFIPFEEQDVQRWDQLLLSAAERQLARAAALGRHGRFQIEAAIQSAHVCRRLGHPVTRGAILALHEQLVAIAPTDSNRVGLWAAQAEVFEAQIALNLAPDDLVGYQPYHAVKASILGRANRPQEATSQYDLAISACVDSATRTYLELQRKKTLEKF